MKKREVVSLIDNYIRKSDKESIELLTKNIEIYEILINDLMRQKPLWFHFKKRKEYNHQLNELKEKYNSNLLLLEKELDNINNH